MLSAGLTLAMTAAGAAGAAGAAAGGTATAGPADPPGNLLTSLALGLNTAPWDYVYAANTSAGGGVDVIQPLLKAAGIGLIRYGGGAYADYYDWQTNTNIQTCIWGNPFGSFTGAPFPFDTTAPFTGASCDNTDSLPFDPFSSRAKAIGAQSFVTVNYGSGTPAEAAAWVSHRAHAGARGAVGGGQRELRLLGGQQLAGSGPRRTSRAISPTTTIVNGVTREPDLPADDPGRRPGDADPGDLLRGQRPLVHGRDEDRPTPRPGSACPGPSTPPWLGAATPDNAEWNNTVLGQDGPYVSFVDAHFYPFSFDGATGDGNPSDQQVLQALMAVPSLYRADPRRARRLCPGSPGGDR